jgi:hypothetical protein
MDKNTADKNDEISRIVKEVNDFAFRYPGAQKAQSLARQGPRNTPPTLNDIAFAYPRSRRQ